MAQVKDIIKSRKFAVAREEMSLKKVAKILTDKKVTNLPVIDAKGNLKGIISEKDIIGAFNRNNFMKMKAKDAMTTKIISVKDTDALEAVAKIFSEKTLRKLPVLKRSKVIGVITRDDIISSFMKYY
jgi:CBS domain-containing protein